MRQSLRQTRFGLMFLAALAVGMTPLLVLAAGNGQGFDAVVRGIEDRYHAHATKIPFMGLISLVAGRATHGGVQGMHVASFEHFPGPVDGTELNTLVEAKAGKGWSRMVRETSRSGNEQSLIFVRDEGSHIGMLVVDLSGGELDVVQMSLNPNELAKQVSEHTKKHAGEDADGHDEGASE